MMAERESASTTSVPPPKRVCLHRSETLCINCSHRVSECTCQPTARQGQAPTIATTDLAMPSPKRVRLEIHRSESRATTSTSVPRLTSLQLRLHSRQQRTVHPWVWVQSAIGGRRVCLPGVSIRGDWRVPGQHTVGAVVGELVLMVGDGGGGDADGKRFRVSAVIEALYGWVAPKSFELYQCADELQIVTVVFADEVAEFQGLPHADLPCADVEDVATPPTPTSPTPT